MQALGSPQKRHVYCNWSLPNEKKYTSSQKGNYFKICMIKTFFPYLFICFQPFYRTTLNKQKRKNCQKQKQMHRAGYEPGTSRLPVLHLTTGQSHILRNHWKIKEYQESFFFKGKTTQFLNKLKYLNYYLHLSFTYFLKWLPIPSDTQWHI